MKVTNVKKLRNQNNPKIAILHTSDGIMNRKPNGSHSQTATYKAGSNSDTGSGSVYLNSKRPLWILEDQVQRLDMDRITFTTTTRRPSNPYYFKNNKKRRQYQPQPKQQQRRNAPSHRYRFQLPQSIQLPSHYISLPHKRIHKQFRHSRQHQIPLRRQTQQQQQQDQQQVTNHDTTMPIFDSLPGDDIAEAMPIFIYNGPKGELILNTMMSARKYPMQEPVPGQILYPPTAPIFRPKPIVERFRVPGRAKTLNLTLIPFYAHEAINPRSLNQQIPAYDYALRAATTETTPTPPAAPTVLYSVPAAATEKLEMKNRRHKKAKQYSVYHSPNDVQWRPTAATLELMAPSTTPLPLALASPLQNHRYGATSDADIDMDEPTTMKPLNNFKLTYKDDEDQFQIVYVDECLEKPTAMVAMPTKTPVLSSRYAIAKEYYAFPVYTLGKLLKPDTEKSMNFLTEHGTLIAEGQRDLQEENADKDNADTWFILNSRYKGHHNHNERYRLSSKYIQNAAHEPSATSSLLASAVSSETARVNDNEFVA